MNHRNGGHKSLVPKSRSFIKYEVEAVAEMEAVKPENSLVSGRLLSLLYTRLHFWSKYATHKHKNKRFFYKSIKSLAEELGYSTKQISRALFALLELGLIIREKLAKHRYFQVWFYHLPKSPHTTEIEPPVEREQVRAVRGAAVGGQSIHITTTPMSAPTAASVSNQSIQAESSSCRRKNVPFTSKEKSNIKNTLKTIVDKCLIYGKVGIEEGQRVKRRECLGFG
ncbi:hypothetical protein EBQ91_00025 [bacterium]|nr:hypothetical protein [bacterium]